MDIHPPEKPIHSVKDFFIQLLTVTVGILIALGLEQSVEAYHHHELASEARANILSELRDNKDQIDDLVKGMKVIEQDHQHVLNFLNQLLAGQHPPSADLSLKFVGPDLSATSWTTAQTVGALSFINYQQVKDFAEAYDVQQQFQRVQNSTFDANNSAAYFFVAAGGFERITHQELQEAKHAVEVSIGAYGIYEQVAKELSNEYAAVLSKYASQKK